MTSNWAYNLDLLAQNGVLDFDGAAFVTDQAPRYVGRPCMPPSPYVGQIPPAPALKQPEIDEFKQQNPVKQEPQNKKIPEYDKDDENLIHNPSWKKWAFGALALGGIVFAAVKAKSIGKWIKNLFTGKIFKKFSWKKVGNLFKKTGKSIKKFFIKGWNKIKSIFKKKTTKP